MSYANLFDNLENSLKNLNWNFKYPFKLMNIEILDILFRCICLSVSKKSSLTFIMLLSINLDIKT